MYCVSSAYSQQSLYMSFCTRFRCFSLGRRIVPGADARRAPRRCGLFFPEPGPWFLVPYLARAARSCFSVASERDSTPTISRKLAWP